MKTIFQLVLISSITIFCTSCVNSQKNDLIGKWQPLDRKNNQTEFFSDNTFTYGTTGGHIISKGIWRIEKKNQICIRYTEAPHGDFTPSYHNFILEGDTIVWETNWEKEPKAYYKRIR